MNLIFQTVTTLAPHNVNFWEMSAWHMAYNASVRGHGRQAAAQASCCGEGASANISSSARITSNRGSPTIRPPTCFTRARGALPVQTPGPLERVSGLRQSQGPPTRRPTKSGLPRTNLSKCPGTNGGLETAARPVRWGSQERLPTWKQTCAGWRRNFNFPRTKSLQNSVAGLVLKTHHALCDFRRHPCEP